jgi:hypothetical protein
MPSCGRAETQGGERVAVPTNVPWSGPRGPAGAGPQLAQAQWLRPLDWSRAPGSLLHVSALMPRTRRTGRPPHGPRRRPFLHWQTLLPDEPLLPHELEADAAAVLVGLMEWAARVGVDFEFVLSRAKAAVAERSGKGGAVTPATAPGPESDLPGARKGRKGRPRV